MVNRYYDPTTGQFINVDPDISSTGQPYAYAGDNPVDETDPSGASGGLSPQQINSINYIRAHCSEARYKHLAQCEQGGVNLLSLAMSPIGLAVLTTAACFGGPLACVVAATASTGVQLTIDVKNKCSGVNTAVDAGIGVLATALASISFLAEDALQGSKVLKAVFTAHQSLAGAATGLGSAC